MIPYPNGMVYEGALANDLPNGQGRLTWTDGAVYSGEFVNGHLNDATVFSLLRMEGATKAMLLQIYRTEKES